MEYKITTKSEKETIELAQNFESEKFPNMIICLDGELGSGKTVFTKGIANALGIKESITSPTFNIIKEYDGELPEWANSKYAGLFQQYIFYYSLNHKEKWRMRIEIEIPKEFEKHFNQDKFKDSLERIMADIEHSLENGDCLCAGRYEYETIEMLEKAFENSKMLS